MEQSHNPNIASLHQPQRFSIPAYRRIEKKTFLGPDLFLLIVDERPKGLRDQETG